MPLGSVKNGLILLMLCLGWIQPGLAQESMRFEKVVRCPDSLPLPADGVEESCVRIPKALAQQTVVFAIGKFERNSSDQFSEFTQDLPPGTTVVLQSLGGDLNGGLRLGQVIRARGFNTFVSPKTPLDAGKNQGKCFSACAYAFLGGVQRQVDPTAQYGVHQFWGVEKEISSMQTQKLVAVLGRYIDGMGASRLLLDQAMLTEPGKVRVLTPSQIAAWKVSNFNSSTGLARWRIEALEGGKRLAFATQGQQSSGALLTLAFARVNNQSLALLIVRPDPKEESSTTWGDFFKAKTPVVIEIEAGEGQTISTKKRFELTPVSNWGSAGPKNSPNTRQIWLATSPELIQNLTSSSQFWLKPLWSNVPPGLNEKTLFGTQGLNDAILAL